MDGSFPPRSQKVLEKYFIAGDVDEDSGDG
jgi:hypothetical protein